MGRIAGHPHTHGAWTAPGDVAPPPPPPPPEDWDPEVVRSPSLSMALGAHVASDTFFTDQQYLTQARLRTGLPIHISHSFIHGNGFNAVPSITGITNRLALGEDMVIVASTEMWGGCQAARTHYGNNNIGYIRGGAATYTANPGLYELDVSWLEAMADGDIETQSRGFGAALAALPQHDRRRLRIVILGHELSGSWNRAGVTYDYPGATAVTRGYNDRILEANPGAFRRLVTDIRAGANAAVAGAGNDLKFVWSLMGNVSLASGQDIAEAIYPGDDVVDVIAVNDYAAHKDTEWPAINSMPLSRALHDWLVPFARTHGKPIAMHETGVVSRWNRPADRDYDPDGAAFFTYQAGRQRAVANDLTGPGLAYVLLIEKDRGAPDVVGGFGVANSERTAMRIILNREQALLGKENTTVTINGQTWATNYPLTAQAIVTAYSQDT